MPRLWWTLVPALLPALPVACGGHAAGDHGARAPVAVVVPSAEPVANAGAPEPDAASAPVPDRNPLEPPAATQDDTQDEYSVQGALVRGAAGHQEIVLLGVAPSAALCGIGEGDSGVVMIVSCAWSPGNHCMAITMRTSGGKFVKHSVGVTVVGATLELERGGGTNVHGDNVPVVTCP